MRSHGTRQDWYAKDMHKKKALTMERNFIVKILPAYSTYKGFKVYQMDVKFAFFNGMLEEVCIEQPKGYFDPNKRNMVCKL